MAVAVVIMLVDSHCHLDLIDLAPYQGDISQLLTQAHEAGVESMLCVSIDLESYPRMLGLVEGRRDVFVSVGVHPNDRDRHEPSPEALAELAAHPQNVAIGETGLDYFREDGDMRWQQERFRCHIRAAKLAGKPLIIHTREAREDTIRILKEEGADEVGGVLHCFTESWEMAQAGMALGFYVSFSGIVTFKNADELRDVARQVPLDRMLIETDSPYLAPVPHRGKPNEPKYVGKVCELIAELRGIEPEELARITRDNFYRLFAAATPPA